METPPLRPGIITDAKLAEKILSLGFDMNVRNQAVTERLIALHREVFTYTLLSSGCWNCIINLFLELNQLTKPYKHLYKMATKKENKYSFKDDATGLRLPNGDTVYSNENLTDDIAEMFIRNHPETKELFSIQKEEKIEAKAKKEDTK